MEQRIREIIAEVYSDLVKACAYVKEELDAESLADVVGDRMYDESEEYRNMPYAESRAMTLRVAELYC